MPFPAPREVDIWAVGCLYSEMRCGDPLFPGESDIDQLYLITKLLGELQRSTLLPIGCVGSLLHLSGPLCARHRQLMSRNPMFSGLNIQSAEHKGLDRQFEQW